MACRGALQPDRGRIESKKTKSGAPASNEEGGGFKKMAADPAKRIAARDEEIPDRVYFRPGANMPGRREAPGLESAGRIRLLRQACAQNQTVESGRGPEGGRGCPD